VLGVIVSQLINNALQHARGSNIYISWKTVSEQVELHVDDEGRSIPEAERESIFDRHYRFEGYTGGPSGSGGLELPLVRMYANAVGAKTLCQDSPAGGARFTVVFGSTSAAIEPDKTNRDVVTE